MAPALYTLILTISMLQGACSLRMGRLKVPQYRMKGENALLVCEYDLEDETIYSVKWYKDDEEFYRYVPKSSPPKSSYMVPGVKVDHMMSDDKTVALRSVNLQSIGLYRCEVSAEAPSFASAQKEAHLEVIYPPKEGPHITGDKEYRVGDEVHLNCTAGRSYPASVLHWYINDRKVERQDWLVQLPEVVDQHVLFSSSLGLRFRAVHPGVHHVRCLALSLCLDNHRCFYPLTHYAREELLIVRAICSRHKSINVVALVVTSLVAFAAT